MNRILLERKTSGFTLSYSTGVAMEALFVPRVEIFDEEHIAPERVALKRYDSVYINVRTLLRNILNACDYSSTQDVKPKELAQTLIEEIELIQSLFTNEGKSLIQPTFYDTNYQNFYRGKDPLYKLRAVSTPKQQAWFKTLDTGLQEALSKGLRIVHSGSSLQSSRPGEKALVLTHVTPDLLSHTNFSSMELLESHTGKVKTRREWNTKYSSLGEEKFKSFPWTKQLLCYLGDKYILAPLSITVRRTILGVGKERRWSPTTSPVMVNHDLQKYIKDDKIKTLLKEISI